MEPSIYLHKLPKLPAPVAGLDIQVGDMACWLNEAQYTPGAEFNQLELSALSSWRSFAGAVQVFFREP